MLGVLEMDSMWDCAFEQNRHRSQGLWACSYGGQLFVSQDLINQGASDVRLGLCVPEATGVHVCL